jgi:hypothetical protein
MVLLLAGCGDDGSEVEARPQQRAAAAERAAIEEALAEETPAPASAWPAEVVSLRESVGAFESMDSCRTAMRAALPTEAAELLADVGYEAFLEDVCGGLAALKERSGARCDALSTSASRKGCRRRLALIAGDPAACPEDGVLPGREPVCLAWARRDAALCRAALALDQTRCRAVIEGIAACARERGGDRGRCEAAVRRYGPSIGEERRGTELVEGVLRLELNRIAEDTAVDPTAAPPPEAPPLIVERPVPERGVHLEAHECGYRVIFGERNPIVGVAHAGRAHATIALEVPAAAEAPIALPLGMQGARIEITTPSGARLSSDIGATGTATVREWRPEHGAPIAVRIEGSLDEIAARMRVSGEVRTYVRDVDPLPASCGGTGASASPPISP